MKIFQQQFVALSLSLFVGAAAQDGYAAKQPQTVLLWPAGAPGARGQADADKPKLLVHLPDKDKAVGAAVVVCPGGGYATLAMGHEGADIAEWFNSFGVAAFVLQYRHHGGGYRHPAPLDDAQRAMRTVRSRADEWKLDPKRIGIMGFSAGGHLASTAATHFDRGRTSANNPIDRASCRPDFLILAYPVISFTASTKHSGSRNHLLGDRPDPKLVESLSNEKQVTWETPPTFIFHTDADTGVLPENSVLFYLALRQAKVPAELHIYEHGVHGVGLAAKVPATSSWPDRLIDWMRGRELLGKP